MVFPRIFFLKFLALQLGAQLRYLFKGRSEADEFLVALQVAVKVLVKYRAIVYRLKVLRMALVVAPSLFFEELIPNFFIRKRFTSLVAILSFSIKGKIS